MNLESQLVLASAVLILVPSQLHAAYLGLGGQLHTQVSINGTFRNVWRVYAVFNDPDDYLSSVAGSGELGPLTIRSNTGPFGAPGDAFFNTLGGNTAPTAELIGKIPNAQWDTFATIGVAINDGSDGTSLSPGFGAEFGGQFIVGNIGTTSNAAWFTVGPQEQGRAGGPNAVVGTFTNFAQGPVIGMGVLLAQLTVNSGQGAMGTVAIGVYLSDGLAGGQMIANQTFMLPSAPGAIALLGISSLYGSRRRNA